jgi:cobalt-zinc-cadmium resistance protein CzcA
MLNAIIKFSVDNKLVVAMFIVGLISWGAYSVTQLPIDAVPDITNNQVQVLTVAPSQSALDIERLVTFPVEQTMATIPGIEEIRSFSRFGLSVVTIVFSDATDVYWARQQVSERLADAQKQISTDIGTPELAPVTTGLGEIYQYILKTAPGFEDKYDIMELRTIQDWVVRRQLLGTPGVADVSSFGGRLKQFEVALVPEKLRSLNLSITDVFDAIQRNNHNTGGAYIEKNMSAYFIRSEGLVGSIEDIENIVIRNTSGVPLLIRDVGTVSRGWAIRYGAMTDNGQRETVGGVVMMLRGANSSQVIADVKERVAQIERNLPKGVTIEPFLDRTKLVDHAIQTVTKNLAEGALIVVFVLVLLLGNLRAGLIVASVIPLSMLFAVSMMNLFGVSGNLMSLGAIDFGLIVDGAVIIVEASLHHIFTTGYTARLSQRQMDGEVKSSARKMMKAAAFGQIIILIVYLPILSLVGIEGKMFKPMAQTVIFAIMGAFILSLTFVPLASSLFLSKRPAHKRNFSDKIIDWLHRIYEPAVAWALEQRKIVLSIAVGLMTVALYVFSTLGGEFLPELDEGDFAVDTRLLSGSSLTSTVDATLRGEKALLENFPEVERVIAKIGSAEIPTDPMPIEAADMMVVMKEKSAWVSAKTKDEMISKMQHVLTQNVPGVWFGFQHPIQMRFNELMTGARQDVVIKIYGEDLNELSKYAAQVGHIVSQIDGTESLFIENVAGLTQIVIKVKRDKLAQFGLTVDEVNVVINASMAGQSAGLLFEGERRFDIVVRADNQHRRSIEDVRNLNVANAAGKTVPLSQVADVTLETGPGQVQRDDAKRRIVVGFNTQGRDVESIVEELQDKIGKSISFAPTYYVTYGGAFENLQEARARLTIAVPVSLALIFLLLYFTFGSVKQGLLIFTAIPLSAIGGVFALWIRGMPFSISAGVGFIALFGVAVLNGIVLIAEFNQLKTQGLKSLKEVIMKGTNTRLRPVIMTAAVASLGFLPMALSHGSGAEVQKPLATVVIGGLISATLLTLIVLPVLFYAAETVTVQRTKKVLFMVLFFIVISLPGQAQSITLDSALSWTIKNNPVMKAATLETSRQMVLANGFPEIPKADVSLMYGQYNSLQKNDNNVSFAQTIPFPSVWSRQKKLNKELVLSSALNERVTENALKYEVRQIFNYLLYLKEKNRVLAQQDTIMRDMARAVDFQYKTGESTLLAKTAADTKLIELRNQLKRNEADRQVYLDKLRFLCAQDFADVQGEFDEVAPVVMMDSTGIDENPSIAFGARQVSIAKGKARLEAARMMPDIKVGYFTQTLIGWQNIKGDEQYFGSDKRFHGFHVGLTIPLVYAPFKARIKAAALSEGIAKEQEKATVLALNQRYHQVRQELIKNQNSLSYFTKSALKTALLLKSQSIISFKNGELDYNAHLLNLQQALAIEEAYLTTQYEYNQNTITIDYLKGKD